MALPSTWEGFGNPAIESAVHDRPLAIGPYPVAQSCAPSASGGSPPTTRRGSARWLDGPDRGLLPHNHEWPGEHFSAGDLPGRMAALLTRSSGSVTWAATPADAGRHGATRKRATWGRPIRWPDDHAHADDAAAPKRLPADRRRQQLLDVALELFAERGYNATTMDDTAEAAGVTKPLLYQHFDSKRALYLELVDTVATSMLEAIGKAVAAAEGPRQQVEGGFAAYFQLVVTQPAAFNLLFGSNVPNDPELSRAVRTVQDTIAEAIDPLIDAGLDQDHRRLLAYAMVGMAEGASHHFVATRNPVERGTEEAEAGRLARRLADLAWAGLRSVHPD